MLDSIEAITARMLQRFDEFGIEDTVERRLAFLEGVAKAMDDRDQTPRNSKLATAVRAEIHTLKAKRHIPDTLF